MKPPPHNLSRITASLFFMVSLISAQHVVLGQVIGIVANEAGDPLPFSNVLLLDPLDSSLVKGTVADQSGKYRIENVGAGQYIEEVSSVGYQPQFVNPIAVAENGQLVDLGTIALKEAVQQLQDLEITDKRPMFEQKIDRLVVNVASTITFAGSTALEVLQKSPGVTVNRQNNTISLNGKSGIKVMINNKLTYLPMDALVQMLDGMSSANIEKIELITTPPSKYDAEGTAGLIDIVMKENPDLGTNGNFGTNAGYMRAPIWGANASLSHRKRKLGLIFDYSISHRQPQQVMNTTQSSDFGGRTWDLTNHSDRDATVLNQNLRAGLEYNFTKNTKANILLTGYSRAWKLSALTTNNNQIGTDSTFTTKMNIKETHDTKGLTATFGLGHQFGEKESIDLELDYIFNDDYNPSTYENTTTYAPPYDPVHTAYDVGKTTPLSVKVATLDYSNQLSDKVKLEAGLKGSFSHFKNDVSVNVTAQDEWESVDSLTNITYLDENILAAYVSTNWELGGGVTVNAGLRYEFTGTAIDTDSEKGLIDRKLNDFFPTFFFQKKLNKSSSFQLSYTRRITRPTFFDMAPFVFFASPYTLFSGNPDLLPAITSVCKAGLNWHAMFFSLQYSDTRNDIANFQPQHNPDTNIELLFSRNMYFSKSWNLTASIPFSPFKWWDVQSNLSGNQQVVAPDEESKKYNMAYVTANLINTFSLPRDFSIEVSGSYTSKTVFGVYETQPNGSLDIGIQKKLKNNGGTLRLAATNILDTQVWRFKVLDFDESGSLDFDTRSINFTYTKSFGNNKLKKVNIKSGSDEELRRVK